MDTKSLSSINESKETITDMVHDHKKVIQQLHDDIKDEKTKVDNLSDRSIIDTDLPKKSDLSKKLDLLLKRTKILIDKSNQIESAINELGIKIDITSIMDHSNTNGSTNNQEALEPKYLRTVTEFFKHIFIHAHLELIERKILTEEFITKVESENESKLVKKKIVEERRRSLATYIWKLMDTTQKESVHRLKDDYKKLHEKNKSADLA